MRSAIVAQYFKFKTMDGEQAEVRFCMCAYIFSWQRNLFTILPDLRQLAKSDELTRCHTCSVPSASARSACMQVYGLMV